MKYSIHQIRAAQSCTHRLHMPPSFGIKEYMIVGVRAHEVHIAETGDVADSFIVRSQALCDEIMSMKYAQLDVVC